MKVVDKVSDEAIRKKIDGRFHICDVCGYELGFHVSFVKEGDGQAIELICPSCGQRFRVGWKVHLEA